MSETDLWLIAIGLLLALVFPPTRSLLGYVFGGSGPGTKLIAHGIDLVQSLASTVIKAHIEVLRNFQPRRIVFPTLDKKQ